MDGLIFSIFTTQVENGRDFSIVGFVSWARRSSLTIENLDILTFVNKILQLHVQLNNEYVKDEDINLMEEYLESNNETV